MEGGHVVVTTELSLLVIVFPLDKNFRFPCSFISFNSIIET